MVVLGDGAKWVWGIAEERFYTAIQIVDKFHAREHVSDLARLLAFVNERVYVRHRTRWWSFLDDGEVERIMDFFFQGVMALPYHIYVVSSKIPQNEYSERVQYGTAFVFLGIVALIAATSIILRNRLRSRYRW